AGAAVFGGGERVPARARPAQSAQRACSVRIAGVLSGTIPAGRCGAAIVGEPADLQLREPVPSSVLGADSFCPGGVSGGGGGVGRAGAAGGEGGGVHAQVRGDLPERVCRCAFGPSVAGTPDGVAPGRVPVHGPLGAGGVFRWTGGATGGGS